MSAARTAQREAQKTFPKGINMAKSKRKCGRHEMPRVRQADQLARLPRMSPSDRQIHLPAAADGT